MQNSSHFGFENKTTVALFAGAIFGLGLIAISCQSLNSESVSVQEKRTLAAFPALNLSDTSLFGFPRSFEAFYNDKFPYRVAMVGQLNQIKYSVFGVSGNPRVLIGKHRWLFYLDEGDKETIRHVPLFTDADLQTWTKHFEARRLWLAQQGIKYLLFIAPSKCEIYREFVPNEYAPVQEQSRQDQLYRALKRCTNIQFLDLRTPLLSAKKQQPHPLYYKTDTHWNTLGAFIVYEYITDYLCHLFPSIKPRTFFDMNIMPDPKGSGDLAYMLGLNDQMRENAMLIDNKSPLQWTACTGEPLPTYLNSKGVSRFFITKTKGKPLPNAFVLGDSFMEFLQPLLSDHFQSASYYYWPSDFPHTLIQKEMPDIVIEEIVERDLYLKNVPDPTQIDHPSTDLFAAKKADINLSSTNTAAEQ